MWIPALFVVIIKFGLRVVQMGDGFIGRKKILTVILGTKLSCENTTVKERIL